MHSKRLFLLQIILVYELNFSTTAPFQVSFSHDKENNSFIKLLTKSRYKLVGIKLRFKNDTVKPEVDKNYNIGVDTVTKTPIEVTTSGVQNASGTPKVKPEKSILRAGMGWTTINHPFWVEPFPVMKEACEIPRHDWINDCPPGYHLDQRTDKEILAEKEQKIIKAQQHKNHDKPKWQVEIEEKIQGKIMTSSEEHRLKHKNKDAGVTTSTGVPRECIPNLSREYQQNMYVGFIHK